MNIKSKIKLLDGNEIPRFGYGTWLLKDKDVKIGIEGALDNGYIHIDTAQIYNNEYDIGQVLSSYDRDKIFITSKVWTINFKKYTEISIVESLRRLNIKYIDLMLLHWPCRNDQEYIYNAYKGLMDARKNGLVKSIGVSNFSIEDLQKIYDKFGEWPVVNQIIMSPKVQSNELVKFCQERNIIIEGYSLLRIFFTSATDPDFAKEFSKNTGRFIESEIKYLNNLSEKYQKTVPQIILKWALQRDFVIFPKSTKPSRIKENANIFDFSLDSTEINTINEMNAKSNKKQTDEQIKDFDFDFEKGLLFEKHF